MAVSSGGIISYAWILQTVPKAGIADKSYSQSAPSGRSTQGRLIHSTDGADKFIDHNLVPAFSRAHDHKHGRPAFSGEGCNQLPDHIPGLIRTFIGDYFDFFAADDHLLDLHDLHAHAAATGLLFEGLADLLFHLL